jgi:hypothetical protein
MTVREIMDAMMGAANSRSAMGTLRDGSTGEDASAASAEWEVLDRDESTFGDMAMIVTI